MAVRDEDRAYFQRVGAIKAASHADALARHQALSITERLDRSWNLSQLHRGATRLDDHDDDPSPFYDRARALGLYRP